MIANRNRSRPVSGREAENPSTFDPAYFFDGVRSSSFEALKRMWVPNDDYIDSAWPGDADDDMPGLLSFRDFDRGEQAGDELPRFFR